MLTRIGATALLAVILGVGTVPPAGGTTGGGEETEKLKEARSPARERMRQRRGERQGQKQWISVPEFSPAEALALVGKPGVVIIDVTCRERGADIPDRIPGAVWRDCTKVEEWAHRYDGAKTILVYCA